MALDLFAFSREGRAALWPPSGLFETYLGTGEKPPLVVSLGMGVDSIAMTITLIQRGIRPGLIIFSDTAGEKPPTMAYLPVFDAWLRQQGAPPITIVRYRPRHDRYHDLEGECLTNATLPGAAMGVKSCSAKHKAEPIHRFIGGTRSWRGHSAEPGWAPALQAWAMGQQVVQCIGFDAGPKDQRRTAIRNHDARYRNWYVLRELGWDRRDCAAAIAAAGLPPVIKSACFFCPHSTEQELRWLAFHHPDLFARAIAIEDHARPRFHTTEGMWRRTRKADGRPGSWRAWAEREGLIRNHSDGGFDVIPPLLTDTAYPDAELSVACGAVRCAA